MSETAEQSVLPLGGDGDDVPAPGNERPGLTGIVPALNEEANLEACIESFREICDEIIVVDSGSTDRTVEIARRYTDRIYVRPWVDYRTFLKFAMPRARYRWLLIVDCDERLTPSLRKEVRDRVDQEGAGAVGFRMKRASHFLSLIHI